MRMRWIAALATSLLSACSDFEGLSRGHDGGGLPPRPAHCSSGALDGDESDLDCGGACAPCDVDRACRTSQDCQTRTCFEQLCNVTSGPPGWVTLIPGLPTARDGYTMTTGADGRVYVVGGTKAMTSTLAPLEAYDPDTGVWQTLAPINEVGVGYGAATGSDARIYAIGGPSIGPPSTSVEAYDVALDTWTSEAPLPSSRTYFATTAGSDGRIYVLAGVVPLQGFTAVQKEDFEIFERNPTGHWITKPLPAAWRGQFSAAASRDGLVFLMTSFPATTGVYDPARDTWSAAPPMRNPRILFTAVLGGDARIYLVGGNAGDQLQCEALDQMRWSPTAPLPGIARAAARGRDGRIYATDGRAAYAYGPRLLLSTRSAPAGQALDVSGDNFATRAVVSLLWDDSVVPVGSAETDDMGLLFPLRLSAPGGAGVHRLWAVDDRSRYRVSATMLVQ